MDDEDSIILRIPVDHYRHYYKSILASYASIIGPFKL
jgi:hypothetical protein